ncbi:DUF4037 domain-containing protein [Brevibacillus borstelensis]|uniref:DUF4037 domain-containing protein n=1 Tax=Brevibacillus borstelensis TaxID=45462 RepID=UPI0030BBCF98
MTEQKFLEDVVNRLRSVAGLEGIVLRNAGMRESHVPDSGTTMIIYYDSHSGMDVHDILKTATTVDTMQGKLSLSSVGEWSPWVSDGVAITVQQRTAKLLLRDVCKLSETIDECSQGIVKIDYQIGYAHCFSPVMYMGEISLGDILWDRNGKLAELKERTKAYPAALKQTMIERFLWEASYSLRAASKSASKKDLSYTAGICYRVVSCLHQVLFALNESYWPDEMDTADLAGSLKIAPANYIGRVNEAFRLLNANHKQTEAALDILRSLLDETVLRI